MNYQEVAEIQRAAENIFENKLRLLVEDHMKKTVAEELTAAVKVEVQRQLSCAIREMARLAGG